MIKAIIVDDEDKSISVLTKFIKEYCTNIEVIGTAKNISAARTLIETLNPQLVFLDVEMPHGTGFDLLDLFDDIKFETIFITAYSQYAVEAFRYASVDYLLKPLDIDHLKEAVKKAENRIASKLIETDYKALLESLEKNNILEQKVKLVGNNEQYVVKVNEILYCVADRSYTILQMTNNRKFIASKNLKHFEDILPKSIFCRIHYGHIININHIQRIVKGLSVSVIMNDNIELEIALRRREEFFKML